MMKHLSLMLMTMILCVALAGCHSGSTFDGNKTSDADSFQMDYAVLNRQEQASLELTAGDAIMVSIAQESGTVDVIVGINEKEPIYEGNGLTNTSFTLNITEAGTYQIIVTGHSACGSVSFTKVTAEPEAEAAQHSNPDQSAMYAAYQFVLQQIAFEHIYPDGADTGFDSASGFIEDNHFAIFDINGDGVDELIVQFTTAPMAGNMETVYTYNESDNTVETLLTVFPAVTYYDNGLVKEEWSHGSGLAGEDYWPYNLYQYCAETGTYEMIAEVNMWSKAIDTVDYKGDPYPEDIDTENAGTVFILTRNGTTETVSKSDYEAWLSEVMGDAHPIQIPYQSLTEDNIRAVCEE